MVPFQTYYLHHSATNETSSFGPVSKFSKLIEVIHNPSLASANSKIVDIDEARNIWSMLVGEGFKRCEKG